MAKEKKKVDPQQRKQRKLIEQDQAKKKIPLNIFKSPNLNCGWSLSKQSGQTLVDVLLLFIVKGFNS